MTPQNVLKAGTVLLGLLLAASQAHAISRYNSTSMSCADIGAVVRAEGAVVLRWKQPPDIQRFDRFVAHTGFCSWGERGRTVERPVRRSPLVHRLQLQAM